MLVGLSPWGPIPLVPVQMWILPGWGESGGKATAVLAADWSYQAVSPRLHPPHEVPWSAVWWLEVPEATIQLQSCPGHLQSRGGSTVALAVGWGRKSGYPLPHPSPAGSRPAV